MATPRSAGLCGLRPNPAPSQRPSYATEVVNNRRRSQSGSSSRGAAGSGRQRSRSAASRNGGSSRQAAGSSQQPPANAPQQPGNNAQPPQQQGGAPPPEQGAGQQDGNGQGGNGGGNNGGNPEKEYWLRCDVIQRGILTGTTRTFASNFELHVVQAGGAETPYVMFLKHEGHKIKQLELVSDLSVGPTDLAARLTMIASRFAINNSTVSFYTPLAPENKIVFPGLYVYGPWQVLVVTQEFIAVYDDFTGLFVVECVTNGIDDEKYYDVSMPKDKLLVALMAGVESHDGGSQQRGFLLWRLEVITKPSKKAAALDRTDIFACPPSQNLNAIQRCFLDRQGAIGCTTGNGSYKYIIDHQDRRRTCWRLISGAVRPGGPAPPTKMVPIGDLLLAPANN